jgi:O-antigen/teichoic acid export membrane protein
MKSTVENRTLQSALIGIISFTITFFQTIIIVPILLKFWGAERYGFWLSIVAIYGLVQTVNSGYQSYLSNEFCKLYTTNNAKLKKIMASGILVDCSIALISFLILLAIVFLGFSSTILGINNDEIIRYNLGISIIIMIGFWLLTSSSLGIISRLYAASGLFSRSLWWGIIARLSQALSLAFTAVLGGDILAASIVSSIVIILVNVFLGWDIYRHFHQLYPFWIGGDWKTGWYNFSKSMIVTSSNIILQLQNNGVIFKITVILGSAELPLFITIRTLSNTLLQANTIITYPLIPEMTRYHVQGEHNKLVGTLAASWWISSMFINLGLIVSLPFIEPVYLKWTQGKIGFDWSLYLLLAWQTSIKNFGSPLVSYLISINNLRSQIEMAIFQTVIVLGGAILFISQYGLIAVGIAVALGELVSSVFIPIRFAYQEIEKLGGHLPVSDLLLSILGVIIVGFVFLGVGMGWLNLTIGVTSGCLGLLVIYAIQWINLPTEVKIRLQKLLKR